MSVGTDADRATRITGFFVISIFVLVIGGVYFLWSFIVSPPPSESKVDIHRVSMSVQSKSEETPAYRELLKQYNQEGMKTAQQENSSFIANIPFEQENVDEVETGEKEQPFAPKTSRENHYQEEYRRDRDKDDQRQKALDGILARLKSEEKKNFSTGIQFAQVMGSNEGSSGYIDWKNSLADTGQKQKTSTRYIGNTGNLVKAIIPSYWRGPGIIDIGVNSDNSTVPVLGRFLSGPYSGGILKAQDGAKLAGDGVLIHFTEMELNGVDYKIDAYALRDDTLLANVATDVNHRYFSRIVLPAVLNGIGGISDMYAQANTEIVNNSISQNAVTVRPGTPDGKAVAGVIAGGFGSQAAKVLSEDAARRPVTQVTITKGQVIAIQFMRGVYPSDAITPEKTPDRITTPENTGMGKTKSIEELEKELQESVNRGLPH